MSSAGPGRRAKNHPGKGIQGHIGVRADGDMFNREGMTTGGFHGSATALVAR